MFEYKKRMNSHLKITIIGISDQQQESFSSEAENAVFRADYFAGGKRHHERVGHLLPEKHDWTNITVPLTVFFKEIKVRLGYWVVFASGDPLFFGIANSLKREFPAAEIIVIPYFNSLQLLAHRTATPYGLYRTISLTGRPWQLFDAALINGESHLALLTDRKNTPTVIAARMQYFGYDNYELLVGECMGGSTEKITWFSVKEAAQTEFQQPNCLFLTKIEAKCRLRGISETLFEGLPGRPKMITKMPVRLTTLALMQLQQRSVFWDVGACTGSISIEAKIQVPHLQVRAFEIRPESEGIITRNCQTFGVPGISLHIGDYLQEDKTTFEKPDAVFLGGYGGQMEALLDDINQHLQPGGVLAFNAVRAESEWQFLDWAKNNHFRITTKTKITVDDFNAIIVIVIQKI